jgi:hypothetical protein
MSDDVDFTEAKFLLPTVIMIIVFFEQVLYSRLKYLIFLGGLKYLKNYLTYLE